MMKKVFFTTLLLLLCAFVTIQGMPTSKRQRCLCRGKDLPSVQIHRIAEAEFHRPSASCDREELIVTLKPKGRKKCLNVNLEQGRIIKEAIMKKKK
ncbi:C-X-C motif chemokine 11-like [Eublepharis macularius]|uniref:C-X-C motif chemokine 11-like n=1 Tax=Eublepharis macularius TaxID=481883 RepID=A0AA97JX36_EUBMA|nr:C-X-C motif chemokine 11-like [Eublepharis macularius]